MRFSLQPKLSLGACACALLVAMVGWLPGCSTAPTTDAIPLILDQYHVRALQMDSFWRSAAHAAEVVGQDGGNSIPLRDGSALWTFGDTWLGRDMNKPDGGASSSALRVSVTNGVPTAKYLVRADGRAEFLLPLEAPESWDHHRIWPAAGVQVGGISYLYFNRIRLGGGTGSFDFKGAGIGLAEATGNSWAFQRVVQPDSQPPLPVLPHSIVAWDDGYLYLYSITEAKKGESAVALSRVAVARIREAAAYEFWTGKGSEFSSSPEDAAPLVRDVWGQVSVAWNPFLKRLVMLHVGGLFREPRSVFLRTAESPAGPWSKPTRVLSLGGSLGKDFAGLLYCAFLHPELFREDGRILAFTYCVHGVPFGNPNFVEVELDRE